MGFLRQTYKGVYDWWRWLLVLGIFVPHTFRSYLKKGLQPLFEWLPTTKENSLISELSAYLIILPLLIILFRFIHRRDFSTLVTARTEFDWVRFFLSFATWGIFTVVLLLIALFFGEGQADWNINVFSFVKLVILCLFLVPVRAFFEDVLFKGYFMQFLTYYFKLPWITVLVNTIVTSVLMHIINSYLFDLVGFHIFVYYFMVNLLSCIIVILDDGLEIILGMKIGNNLSILLFTSLEIYSNYDESVLASKTALAIILLTHLSVYVGFPLYFLFLRKTYGWHNWKEKLFAKVENN